MTKDDEFRRYLDSQFTKWQESKKERQDRTISQMWDEWIEKGARPAIKVRDGWFHRWLEVRFDDGTRVISLAQLAIGDLNTSVLSAWLDAVAKTPGTHGKPICGGTVNQIRLGVQAMFSWHLARGEISQNLLRRAHGIPKTPGHDRVREGRVTREQMEEITAKMPLVSGFLARHMWFTALRFNNIRLLRKDQVDLEGSRLVLTVKGRKRGLVPIGSRTRDELRRLIDLSPSAFVYPSVRKPDRPIAPSTLHYQLKAACKEAKITHVSGEKITYHHFRHGRASAILSQTGDIKKVSVFLTHSSVRSTERYLKDEVIRSELAELVKDE